MISSSIQLPRPAQPPVTDLVFLTATKKPLQAIIVLFCWTRRCRLSLRRPNASAFIDTPFQSRTMRASYWISRTLGTPERTQSILNFPQRLLSVGRLFSWLAMTQLLAADVPISGLKAARFILQ